LEYYYPFRYVLPEKNLATLLSSVNPKENHFKATEPLYTAMPDDLGKNVEHYFGEVFKTACVMHQTK
jgi:hypothetical protein